MHAPIADQSYAQPTGLTVVCAVVLLLTMILGLITQSITAMAIGVAASLVILCVVGVSRRTRE